MELNMPVLQWYLLFALTTGIVSYFELFKPVLEEIELNNPNDMILQAGWLGKLVLIGLGIVFAPFFIFPCLIPSIGKVVKEGLLSGMKG